MEFSSDERDRQQKKPFWHQIPVYFIIFISDIYIFAFVKLTI